MSSVNTSQTVVVLLTFGVKRHLQSNVEWPKIVRQFDLYDCKHVDDSMINTVPEVAFKDNIKQG